MLAASLSKPSKEASRVAARLTRISPVATASRAVAARHHLAGGDLVRAPSSSSSRAHSTTASRAAASRSWPPSASVQLGGPSVYAPITHSWRLAAPGEALLLQLSR